MVMVNNIRAKSWSHLHQLLFEGSWQEPLKRHRSGRAFRGLGGEYPHELSTTLIRLGGDSSKLEGHILHSFKKYAYHDLSSHYGDWYWLTLAQHHGLPTRLLDWTYSPYVALHFATDDLSRYGQDGVIWSVDYYKTTEALPKLLSKVISDAGNRIMTVEMLNDEVKKLTDFDNLASGNNNFVVFFEPPSIDQRIVNQFGFFSVMSDNKVMLDDWLKDRPDYYTRIIIPAQLKWEIRNKLDQMNINERVLFPGYDGLSKWLTRYYGPSPDGCVNTEDVELA